MFLYTHDVNIIHYSKQHIFQCQRTKQTQSKQTKKMTNKLVVQQRATKRKRAYKKSQ